ncbi:MAG: EamA family transporter [Chloroflexi bacterium]|nr:EamA family transporter [Chloroflexota bacterium]
MSSGDEHGAAEHPRTPERSQTAGYLAVVLATACWAASGIFVSFIMAGREVSALALAFWRDLFTFAILLAGLRLLRPSWLSVPRRDLKWLAGLGSIGLGTFHVLWNLNVMLNGVAVATVQQAAMPAIVAVAAWLLWREPLTRRKGLAIVLTFAGTVLISGLDALGRMELSVPALLVGLSTPVTYAAYSLFGKPIAGRYHPLTILTYGFGFGALTLLPFQFFTPQPWPVPGQTWLWFAVLIGFATIVPFSFYTFGLGLLPASVAGILAMTEIPVASLYAYVFLGERLTAPQTAGAALVIAGVLLLSWGRWRGRGGG